MVYREQSDSLKRNDFQKKHDEKVVTETISETKNIDKALLLADKRGRSKLDHFFVALYIGFNLQIAN